MMHMIVFIRFYKPKAFPIFNTPLFRSFFLIIPAPRVAGLILSKTLKPTTGAASSAHASAKTSKPAAKTAETSTGPATITSSATQEQGQKKEP